MRVCLTNINPKVGNKKKNIRKMEKVIDSEEADVYIFGEMSLTGYICREEVFSLAEDINVESIKNLQEIAKENDCIIIFGMPIEERKGIVYNSAVMVQSNSIGIYHKNFLANFGPFEEKFYFKEGNEQPIFKTKFGNVGLCICYDIFFPEITKIMALKGADLIACISASPTISKDYFERVLPARAIENTVYMAYCNLVGEEDGLTFWGGSQIYSPKGELLAKAEYFKEDSIVCDIDLDTLKEARIARPTLRDTKPDIYLEMYGIAKGKNVFSEDVKKGMEIAYKIGKAKEIEVYGNEDVAYGIKLVLGNVNIELIKSNEIKAIVKDDGREVKLNRLHQ